jgi:hypothetical protein
LDGEEVKFLAAFMSNVKVTIDDQSKKLKDQALPKLSQIPQLLEDIVTNDYPAELLNEFMHKFITVDDNKHIKSAPPLDACLKLRHDVLSQIDATDNVSIIDLLPFRHF